jgi:hypothetical protein
MERASKPMPPVRSGAEVLAESRARFLRSPRCERCHVRESAIVRRDRAGTRVLCEACARGEPSPCRPSTPADPRELLKRLARMSDLGRP